MNHIISSFKRTAIAVLAAAAVLTAAPAIASATVTLPPGVVQAGPTTFVAQPSLCSCVSSIDGYVFSGLPYSPFVRDVFLGLPASTPTAVDLWFDLRAQPGYSPGAPVTSISTTVTVSGTVDDDSGGDNGDGSVSPRSYGTG